MVPEEFNNLPIDNSYIMEMFFHTNRFLSLDVIGGPFDSSGSVTGKVSMLPTVMREVRFVLAVCIVVTALSPGVGAQNNSGTKQLKRRLTETIAKIRTEKTSTSRTEAAERLATMTRGINPYKVDNATLAEMVSLLETDEDSVRAWVAASLGHLGPRAKLAVPRLFKLLPDADCLRGSLTSAPFIRVALKRMGEKPPPPSTCN